MPLNTLTVLLLNIRSLRNKLDDLCRLAILHTPDVICINETWLNSTIADGEIMLPGYSVLRSDRHEKAGGGVCLYFKTSLPLRPRRDIQANGVECCFAEISCKPSNCIVGTVYRPPSEPVQYWESLDAVLQSAVKPGKNLVMCGDFNVNIDRSTGQGPHLLHFRDLVSSYNLYQSVQQPTRIGLHGPPSTIDLMFNTFDPSDKSTVIPVAFSDHSAVISHFRLTPDVGSNTEQLCRNIRALDHDQFRADLVGQNLCNIAGSPSAMWEEWSSRFVEVLNAHAPQQRRRVSKRKTTPWMDRQLLHLLSKRNRLHRKWISIGTEQAYNEFSTARREATNYNRARKLAFYRTQFQECSGNSRKTWQMIKTITGNIKTNQPPPQCTVESIRSVFSAIVEDKSRPSELSTPQGPSPVQNLSVFSPVSIARIRKLLEKLDTGKATGSDDIPAVLLRRHADILAPSLTLIINKSLREGSFPKLMKVAKIRPLFKGGDPSEGRNYRPVSLLPVISKILERLVHAQLSTFLSDNGLIPDTQFGYRRHHSTTDALVLAIESITKARIGNQHTGVAFVDMSKAFDKVKHQVLINDLFALGISGTVLSWLADYLSERQQYVQVVQQVSTPYGSSCGVPQGSVLGPLLFVVYVRDIAAALAPLQVATIQFADDISLRASSTSPDVVRNRLTGAVQLLANWLKRRGLILNESKTQILAIPPFNSEPVELRITCNSQVLPTVTSAKYLGMHFDADMSWVTMVDHVAQRVSAKIAVLLRHAGSLPFTSRLDYLRCFILPDFLYACISYMPYLAVSQELRLQRLLNRAVRAVFRVPPWASTTPLFDRLHLLPLSSQLKLRILCFIWKCMHGLSSNLFNDFFLRSQSIVTRGAQSNLLVVPLATSAHSAKRITHVGAKLWNELPAGTRCITKLLDFKTRALHFVSSR